MDGSVTAEERVQTRFQHVTVTIAPRGELAAENRPFFQNERGPAGVGQVLRGGKAGGTTADDDRVE
jgi:hypothetical protein